MCLNAIGVEVKHVNNQKQHIFSSAASRNVLFMKKILSTDPAWSANHLTSTSPKAKVLKWKEMLQFVLPLSHWLYDASQP